MSWESPVSTDSARDNSGHSIRFFVILVGVHCFFVKQLLNP